MVEGQPDGEVFRRDAVLQAEFTRLVRLCARASGDRTAAEDLAQETLLEAWRVANRLTDVAGFAPWLSAIARNVCRRWARRRAHERLLSWSGLASEAGVTDSDGAAHEPADLQVDLERAELAELLARALALLPPPTRALLVERYIRDMPLAEVAARAGVSEGTLAVRLHRGRLALRRVLATRLRDAAAAHGLVDAVAAEWRETRLWCPVCGRHRLLVRLRPPGPELTARCPTCCPDAAIHIAHGTGATIFGGVTRPKPALARLSAWAYRHYRQGLAVGAVPCGRCGRPTPVRLGLPAPLDRPPWFGHGIHLHCDACGATSCTALVRLALDLPEVQAFWRRHPRMCALPAREVEADGRPALITSFVSLAGDARLDVVSAGDTLAILRVASAPHA